MNESLIFGARSGYPLLARLHARFFRARPEMDILSILLVATVCFLGAMGLMLNQAVREMFLRSGDSAVVMTTSRGSSGEVESFISALNLPALKSALSDVGIDTDALDEQLVISSAVPDGLESRFLTVRGADASAVLRAGKLRIVDGRMYGTERNELIVGRAASRAFPQLALGKPVVLGGHDWEIVGIFEMKGDVRESEVMGDLQRVQYVNGAHGVISSARIHAADAADAVRMIQVINNDAELGMSARTEANYFDQQSRPVLTAVNRMQALIMSLMIPAALLGLLSIQRVQNMHMLKELRLLSFIGFQRKTLRISLMARALVVGLVAGIIGCVVVEVFVAGHSLEMQFGLQVLQIQFQSPGWMNATIMAGSCLLPVVAAQFGNIDTDFFA